MESQLSASVDSLIEVLCQMAQDEISQVLNVSSEIENLTDRTRRIQGVLFHIERRQTSDEGIKQWVAELENAVFDAEDALDLYQITDKKRRVESSTSSYSVANCFKGFLSKIRDVPFARKTASKIKEINTRMDEIVKDMPLLSLTRDGDNLSNARRMASRTSPEFAPSDLVGLKIEEDAKELTELLTKETTGLEQGDIPIIAIERIGGIGKTTLAKKVYKDLRPKEEFRLLIWICVSKELRPAADIVKNVIREVGGDHGKAEEISELLPMLKQCVEGKRFFLVLDDVWADSEEVWKGLLREPMLSGARGSRVLVTTRDRGVALRMNAIHRHNINRLSDDDAFSLLMRKVFPNSVESEVRHLFDVGMELVKKCDGLPLAIISIGGMLRTKNNSRGEWQTVLESNVWSNSGLSKDVHKAFYLSYEDLPSPYLKECFIFCSLFPEDFKFHKPNLIHLWQAEGFLKDADNQDVENPWVLGNECYNQLLLRNLLEDTGSYFDQNECKMHDLLWSFARSLGKTNKNYVLREGKILPKPVGSSKVRRLLVEGNSNTTVNTDIIMKEKSLRTLLVFNKHEIALDDICKVVSGLRILDLSESNVSNLPDSLFGLELLRYLHVGGSKIRTLPKSIENLRNLVYLNVARCRELVDVHHSITNLRELRFLNFKETKVKGIPTCLKNLEKLVYLFGFKLEKNTLDVFSSLDELEPLSQLVNLQLVGLENVTDVNIAKKARLWRKYRFRELYFCYTSLSWENQNSQENAKKETIENILNECSPPPNLEVLRIESYYGRTLPNWLNWDAAFPNLRSLEIENCACIRDLAPLGQLFNLDFLRLSGAYSVEIVRQELFWSRTENEDMKSVSCSTRAAFPNLSELEFVNMPNWKEWLWTKEEPAMPKLKKLYVIDCPHLRSLPEGLSHHATSLEHLEIRDTKLDTIENLQSLKGLCVVGNTNLKRVSNLPSISRALIKNCPNLKTLEYINDLQWMKLIDNQMDSLPEYLRTSTVRNLTINCSVNLFNKIKSQDEMGSELLKFKHISMSKIWAGDECLNFNNVNTRPSSESQSRSFNA